ncbi:hypothetical protein L1987_05647 [Smallanthus sonchifolius]|uniref:Uncharacterized protein n=1 Tax=Smallanthus sonchifolius TaxID=185202 RepID=A0ACB9JW18_9ASTR|nr:hypothetical protein L1987_05647 [Smallanthus sonchifolius]
MFVICAMILKDKEFPFTRTASKDLITDQHSHKFVLDSWDLDKVVEIINCVRERGNVVIPAFCDARHSDVREQKVSFGKYESHPRIQLRPVWYQSQTTAAATTPATTTEDRTVGISLLLSSTPHNSHLESFTTA